MKMIGKKLAGELIVVGILGAAMFGLDFSIPMIAAVIVPLGAFIWGEGWVDAKALQAEAEHMIELWRETKGKNKAFWVAILGPVSSLTQAITGKEIPEPEIVVGFTASIVAYIIRQALTDGAAIQKEVGKKKGMAIKNGGRK